MLTKERVSGYTPEYTKENTDLKYLVNKRLMGLAGHDPVTQFIIMKSFWKRRIVEGDSDFETWKYEVDCLHKEKPIAKRHLLLQLGNHYVVKPVDWLCIWVLMPPLKPSWRS